MGAACRAFGRVGTRAAAGLATAILDLTVTKPIAIFVWWLSSRANTLRFERRAELLRRTKRALGEGRPVIFALNHVSMFDDPVIPMALYRTGARATAELLVLGTLVASCWLAPTTLLTSARVAALTWAAGIAAFGVRKVWWSLGDLVNFSGAAALRGRLEAARPGPLSRAQEALLALADRAIYYFMRSGAVKTVFVDRGAGEEAKRTRARAVEATVEIAARAEPVWIFFEGGRTRVPGQIGPARRGVGDMVLALRARGLDPLVVAIRHAGLERVIPRDEGRRLSSGHPIEVRWEECRLDASGGVDAQALADLVRDRVARLESGEGAARVASA